MSSIHQLEQATVMKDLAEALTFGVRIALEEHALQLKTLTEEKVARMKAESQHQKMEAMKELEHKIHQESDNALRHLREASEAETDIMKSRLRGEMAAEHAARVNRLQIEVGSKRSSTERELRTKYENEYLSTMKEMDGSLDQDIHDTLEESEIMFSEKLKNDLEHQRKLGEKRQAAMLVQMERDFQKEFQEMSSLLDQFFSTDTENGSSSSSSTEKHMP